MNFSNATNAKVSGVTPYRFESAMNFPVAQVITGRSATSFVFFFMPP